jgi:hypothetical protein
MEFKSFLEIGYAFLGILGHILFQYLVEIRKKHKILNLLEDFQGWWIEEIFNQDNNRYSIAMFFYGNQSFHYNGTNFHNNGEPYLYWKSREVFYNEKVDQINYHYLISGNKESGYSESDGFGKINIARFDKKIEDMQFGYFVDVENDNSTKTTKMMRLKNKAKEIGFNFNNDYSLNKQKEFIIELMGYNDKKKLFHNNKQDSKS